MHELHRSLGARMVPFAGYEMPVQYPSGIIKEHLHTRAAAGLFDVSHMGQVRLSGAGAAAALESLVPVDVTGLAASRQRYALFTNEQGGILDDLMVANYGDHLVLVVNAACKERISGTCGRISRTAARSSRSTSARCSRCKVRRRVRCWRGTLRQRRAWSS